MCNYLLTSKMYLVYRQIVIIFEPYKIGYRQRNSLDIWLVYSSVRTNMLMLSNICYNSNYKGFFFKGLF